MQTACPLAPGGRPIADAVQTRPVVDQARGVLMATLEADSDEVWQVVRDAPCTTSTKTSPT